MTLPQEPEPPAAEADAGDRQDATFPSVSISNGLVDALLYLPDPEYGYYRGSRFDWAGVFGALTAGGHSYVQQWFPSHDPRLHEAVSGPAEAFLPIGFDAAEPGDSFLVIGIGILIRPDSDPYRFAIPYQIRDNGIWRTEAGEDRVEWLQELDDPAGYSFRYRKTIRLPSSEMAMELEHELLNRGPKPIRTRVFNHNFLTLDRQPTGPDLSIVFPWKPLLADDARGFGDLASLDGNAVRYLRELRTGEIVAGEMAGFGESAADYDIRMSNRRTGAAVRITGDRPISRLYFWSIRTTACPEPYQDIDLEPGESIDWTLRYEFPQEESNEVKEANARESPGPSSGQEISE